MTAHPPRSDAREQILVIRLGAFGDFAQSFPAFAAIRAHHHAAWITLLTTPPFAGLAAAAPWFNAVWPEGRPSWRDPWAILRLGRRLRGAGFQRVYDLQTSSRSSLYRRALPRRTEWSGIAPGASHRHATPHKDTLPTDRRQREQLAIAGITRFPAPALDWLDADLSGLDLPERFWLLVPGSSARLPEKRWPASRYADLARSLDIRAVVVGGPAEIPIAADIGAAAPGTVALCGDRSPPMVLAALARRAAFAVGNDTGPTHLIAALGCPTVAVFGPRSNAAIHAPGGAQVRIVRHDDLAKLAIAPVRAALATLLPTAALGGYGLDTLDSRPAHT